MDTIRVGKTGELVKAEFPRLVTGALGLGKLENVNTVWAQDDDGVCRKDEALITIKGSNNINRFSFIVNKEMSVSLLHTSIRAFINTCKANGLSVKKEFQELYPALVF